MEKMWRGSVTLLPLKYLLLSQRKTPIDLIKVTKIYGKSMQNLPNPKPLVLHKNYRLENFLK